MTDFDFKKIEKRWIEKWYKDQLHEPDMDRAESPYYNLMMFPYPSAEGMHVGNMYAFTGSDVWGRYMGMKGNNVFEPIGLDGFGIHSENFAIKIGEHILDVSKRTEKNFYRQLKMTGNKFAWKRRVETYDETYYKWTQWLFIQMYKKGLAYRKKASVNWCPSCKTVLSDEQVEAGKCERCKSQTGTKDMSQWFFKITDYAERLLNNIDDLNWSEEVKVGQKNWIGKSVGINIRYKVKDLDEEIECFTSYPETNFGATFVVLAPEHPKVMKVTDEERRQKVEDYIKKAKRKSDVERIAEGKDKTGVFTGRYCINGLTGKKMPIYVGDFVLSHVGTGAVVGVPGHDIRDFHFAVKFDLDILRVMKTYQGDESEIESEEKVNHEGIMINSKFINGLDHKEAREKIIDYIEEKGWGERTVHYKLRDWCVSRQRYWGDPIPMIKCEKCGWHPMEEKDLPLKLPEIENLEEVLPDGSGKGPLVKQKEFVETKCPKCTGDAKRETDVMDPFVDSSWYFLRYPSTEFENTPFNKKRTEKWLPVDMYIGGKEHTVLHLLYSRFITMALYDMGFIDFEEPFSRFIGHGLLIKEGSKMSKSKGNVINPDEYIEKFGVDSVRMYLMFLGDFRQGGDWRDNGMRGMYKFVKKVWKLFDKLENDGNGIDDLAQVDRLVYKVEKEIEKQNYNTAIAKIMEFVNWYTEHEENFSRVQRKEALEKLCLVMAPFAPFVTEQLWERLGKKYSIHKQSWPKYDADQIKKKEVTIAVQVNGKLRDTIVFASGAEKDEVVGQAKDSQKVKKYLDKGVKRTIFVQDKIVNFVV